MEETVEVVAADVVRSHNRSNLHADGEGYILHGYCSPMESPLLKVASESSSGAKLEQNGYGCLNDWMSA